MKTIKVEELKEGAIFTKAAYIDAGNIFVMANTPVAEKDIQRLKTYRIKEITTEGEMLPPGTDTTIEDISLVPDGIVKDGGAKIKTEIREEELLDIEDYFKSPLKNFDFEEETKRLSNEGIDKFAIETRNKALKDYSDIIENVRADKFFNADVVKELVNNLVIGIEKNKSHYIRLVNKFISNEYFIIHSVNTCILSLLMGNAVNFTRIKQMSLGMGALLHDIGMVKLPIKITQKKGKLTEQEYNIIRTHPLISYKLLSDSGKFTKDVCMIVLQHHERFDGKGYPRHIKGEAILDLAKIVQIASVYEAMICKRSYREEFQYFDAMRHILNGCQGEFDPVYLKLFLSVMSYYPLGSFVKLSDNRVAEVMMSNPKLPMKPIVRIVLDADEKPIREGERINLGLEAGIYIVKPFDSSKVLEVRSRYNI